MCIEPATFCFRCHGLHFAHLVHQVCVLFSLFSFKTGGFHSNKRSLESQFVTSWDEIPDLDLGRGPDTVAIIILVDGALLLVGVIPGVGRQIVEIIGFLKERMLASTPGLDNRLLVTMTQTRSMGFLFFLFPV